MSSSLISRRDLDFLLHEWLNVAELLARPRFREHSREIFDAAIEVSEQIATRHFRTHNRKGDDQEPTFDGSAVRVIPEVGQALRAFAEADMFAATLDRRHGGLQLPETVAAACFAWFQAANPGTSSYPFLTIAASKLLAAHGSAQLRATFIPPMASGRFFGTMCLSEPQAGSSLSDITVSAVRQTDGTYRLFGNKMWISAGDHELAENIVHLVLARVPDSPPGVKGISLFVVPKFLLTADGTPSDRNDVAVVGLNHKMGYRGAVNTVLAFGEGSYRPGGAAGAVGYLVGEENRGLAYMFHMMNEARIGVGLCAAALGYTGYLSSLEYARSRPQGRRLDGKDPRGPQVPIIEHPDVRRMLLAQKAYVEGALALCLYCGRLVDEAASAEDVTARNEAQLALDVLTPVAKSWPSQWCLEANSLAIQVHGGYGYTRDYPVEQFYRDNRLNMIHEGTHGIQGLDLLGRKAVMHDGAGLDLIVRRVQGTCDATALLSDELAVLASQLRRRVKRLDHVTRVVSAHDDRAAGLSNSTAYLEAFGHLVVAWMWLEQLRAAHGKQGSFYEGKRQAGRYFFRWELPKTDLLFRLVEDLDDTFLRTENSWF